jgi:hypothetical protein
MAAMPPPDDAPEQPGERRLDRPPSDRYREVVDPNAAPQAAIPRAGSPGRGIAFAVLAALAGAGLTVVLGGRLTISAGLLVVAALTGRAVAIALVAGAGDSLPTPRRAWLAAGIAVGGILLGQLGLWLFARTEGGVLALPDYLGQTFGLLVPIQIALALLVAWWSAR